jgi:CheY-like chemotaxis protein
MWGDTSMGNPDQKKILLVEDEYFIAMGERMALEGKGFKVVIASSGEEAVKAMQTISDIDLILMDIDLGSGMDGAEAAAIILKNRDVPLVFLSSHTESEIVEKTKRITSYGHIVKNSGNTVLEASIRTALLSFAARKNAKSHDQLLQ